MAPLITDTPIILVTFIIGYHLATDSPVLGLLSLAGAVYICYLAWESLTIKPVEQGAPARQPHSIKKGVLANFLNPQPYIFCTIPCRRRVGPTVMAEAGSDGFSIGVAKFIRYLTEYHFARLLITISAALACALLICTLGRFDLMSCSASASVPATSFNTSIAATIVADRPWPWAQ